MKITIKTLCVAFALTAIASCNKEQDLPSMQERQSSSIFQSKEELQLQAQFQRQRDAISQELIKQRRAYQSLRSLESQSQAQADYVFDPEATERRVKAQNWGEETKRFYLSLPQIFSGELRCPSIKEVSLYAIPEKEKQMLVNSIAMVNAIQSDRSSFARSLENQGIYTSREERIRAAVKICETTLDQELGDVIVNTTWGFIGGAIVGELVGAVVGGAVAAVPGVINAYRHYYACLAAAKETKSQVAVADAYGAVVPPSAVAPPPSTEVPPSTVTPPAPVIPPSTSAGDSMSTVAPPPPHVAP